MIEGREPHHRLARDIVQTIREHWLREAEMEAQITVVQTIDSTLIQAEAFNTESVVVSITHTNRRKDVQHGA